MLVWLCFTWLKAIRYKGTHSLNPFWAPRSSLSTGRNSYSSVFVTYDLRVSEGCEHVHTYVWWCACVHLDHIYVSTPSLCPRSCQSGSWTMYCWTLASEQRDWQEKVNGAKPVEELPVLLPSPLHSRPPQTSLQHPQEKRENRQ